MVDRQNHAFTTYDGGSTFAPQFPENITSNIFTVDVKATDLGFSQIPARVGVLENFSIGVSATDINQNIDKDFTGQVTLALASETERKFRKRNCDTLINGRQPIQCELLRCGKFRCSASPTLNDIASNILLWRYRWRSKYLPNSEMVHNNILTSIRH
jgi:hypothetical protein